MKTKTDNNNVGATYPINPGDYPLGSLESRAAARARLRPEIVSPEDGDATTLVASEGLLHGTATFEEFRQSAIYKRGREILDLKRKPVLQAHLDPVLQRQTSASLAFERRHWKERREPRKGDILYYDDLVQILSDELAWFEILKQAWLRRLPDLQFPIHIEGRRVFKLPSSPWNPEHASHERKTQFLFLDGRQWEEDISFHPQFDWRQIEEEAFEPNPPIPGEDVFAAQRRRDASRRPMEEMPTIRAVQFVGNTGTHRCRPYTLEN